MGEALGSVQGVYGRALSGRKARIYLLSNCYHHTASRLYSCVRVFVFIDSILLPA